MGIKLLLKKDFVRYINTIGLTIFIISVLFCFQAYGKTKLSKKEEKKLAELTQYSKPLVPIFGKVETPLMAGVEVSHIIPATITPEINVTSEEASTEPIKLKENRANKNNISSLEQTRKELKKTEEEGFNFIQPSLALTPEEQLAIDEFFSRNEQEQLLNLWKATIERNKTIQFIIQKLSPANSPQQANSVLAKTVGAAIFLPFYALQALTNNAGAYYGSQVGGRVLGSVVEGKMNKNQAQLQLSQTESIILFMMIDEVAERLRERYHSYKKLMVERILATSELEEAKQDVLDAQETASQSTQLFANIQRRSIEREIRNTDAQLRYQKNSLVELAGIEAVSEFDKQLKLELAATQNTPLDFLGVEK